MKFGPSNTDLEIAEALEEHHNWLNERNLASEDTLDLLNEAAMRIRELGSDE